MIENMCSSSNQQHLHYLAAISWFFVDLVNLNWLPIIILIFCQRQSPASHVLQKIISCQNVRVKKCMELLSERILDVFIAPVEGSLYRRSLKLTNRQNAKPDGASLKTSVSQIMIPQIECREQKLEIACLNAHLNIKTLHRLVFPHITFWLPSLWSSSRRHFDNLSSSRLMKIEESSQFLFPVYMT